MFCLKISSLRRPLRRPVPGDVPPQVDLARMQPGPDEGQAGVHVLEALLHHVLLGGGRRLRGLQVRGETECCWNRFFFKVAFLGPP